MDAVRAKKLKIVVASYAVAMRIASMCGSLGSKSMNTLALDVAAARLAALELQDVIAVPLADVPMLNPDEVDAPPASVAAMQSVLDDANGVIMAAPEYAGGVAGGMKNALDWLVGSGSIYHRPVVVLSVGMAGGPNAIEQMVRTLSWQGALTVGTLGISAPRSKISPSGNFDDATVQAIEQLADDLVAALSMSSSALVERVATVVKPFGIDPGRFGDIA